MKELMPENGVAFRVRSLDVEVPLRVVGDRILVPGLRRKVSDEAVIVYLQSLPPALSHMPRIFDFLAQFSSDEAAAAIGERLARDLEGGAAVLEVQRTEVSLRPAAIAEALLSAAGAATPGSRPSRFRRRRAASGR